MSLFLTVDLDIINKEKRICGILSINDEKRILGIISAVHSYGSQTYFIQRRRFIECEPQILD